MATPPPRLLPVLAQFDFARERLAARVAGPHVDSGDGTIIALPPLTDEEHLWEPVARSWSIRRHSSGPGHGATMPVGAGGLGRDTARPQHPFPPPVTTIAWRLGHLSEMRRAAPTTPPARARSGTEYHHSGAAAGGIVAFDRAATAWCDALLATDDASLDTVG